MKKYEQCNNCFPWNKNCSFQNEGRPPEPCKFKNNISKHVEREREYKSMLKNIRDSLIELAWYVGFRL